MTGIYPTTVFADRRCCYSLWADWMSDQVNILLQHENGDILHIVCLLSARSLFQEQ